MSNEAKLIGREPVILVQLERLDNPAPALNKTPMSSSLRIILLKWIDFRHLKR